MGQTTSTNTIMNESREKDSNKTNKKFSLFLSGEIEKRTPNFCISKYDIEFKTGKIVRIEKVEVKGNMAKNHSKGVESKGCFVFFDKKYFFHWYFNSSKYFQLWSHSPILCLCKEKDLNQRIIRISKPISIEKKVHKNYVFVILLLKNGVYSFQTWLFKSEDESCVMNGSFSDSGLSQCIAIPVNTLEEGREINVIGCLNNRICSWKWDKLEKVKREILKDRGEFYSKMEFFEDIIFVSHKNQISYFNIKNSKEVIGPFSFPNRITDVKHFRKNLLCIGDSFGWIRFLDIKSKKIKNDMKIKLKNCSRVISFEILNEKNLFVLGELDNGFTSISSLNIPTLGKDWNMIKEKKIELGKFCCMYFGVSSTEKVDACQKESLFENKIRNFELQGESFDYKYSELKEEDVRSKLRNIYKTVDQLQKENKKLEKEKRDCIQFSEKRVLEFKTIIQKEKEKEKESEFYYKNQANLRFTSLLDYKILKLIGGCIGRDVRLKGVNGFVYIVKMKNDINSNFYVMKILRIAKNQNWINCKVLSKNTSEIIAVIKPEFFSYIPHRNVISIYHAFKEDLEEKMGDTKKFDVLKNIEGDENDDVVKCFVSGDLPLNTKTGFLIMEYFEKNLDDLKKERKYSFSEIMFLSILEQLLEGLQHLYSRFIVHRDIKPDNIFVSNLYFVKYKLKDQDLFDLNKISLKILSGVFGVHLSCLIGIEIINKKSFKVECKSKEVKTKLLELKLVTILGKNWVVLNPDQNGRVRCVIGDFGCSFICEKFIVKKKVGTHKHQIFGNPYHFPPEVHFAIHSGSIHEIDYSKSDIFAVGLTCYSIISKMDAFGGKKANERKISDYVEIENQYSTKTKDLLRNICYVDKNTRYSVEEALKELRMIKEFIKEV